MKKITFLIFAFTFTFTFAQVGISENFDSGTPTGWTGSYWNTDTTPCAENSERDNLYEFSATGNLTSSNQAGGSNGTDLTVSFDYKIIDYSGGGATAVGWGSAELQYSTDDGATWNTVLTIDDGNHVTSADCANMSVVIPAASLPNGSDVKLQVANTWAAGDYYFYVDNFSATQVVNDPPTCDSVLSATTDVAIEGDISWNTATGIPSGYNLTVGTTTGGSDILAMTDVGNVTSYNLGLLPYSTTYYVTIEPYNASGVATGCTEQTFVTEDVPPTGSLCSDPIVVGTLPYNTSDDTANYGDDYSGSPGASGCSSTNNYLNGDDVVYAYTATSDTSINIAISSLGNSYSGAFVYTDCGDIGVSCIAGYNSDFSSSDFDFDLNVTNGTTYYVVISTWAEPQSVTYTLDITENTCTNASVTYTVVNDCENNQFSIDVDVTAMGNATALTLSNDYDDITVNVTGTGIYTAGPFPTGANVVITLEHDSDAACNVSSGALTNACPPSNNTCATAMAVSCGNTYSGNTQAATNDVVGDCGSVDNDSPNVFYTYTGSGSPENVTISTCGDASYDTSLAVYTGTCGTLVCYANNDDGSGCTGYTSELTFLSDGTTTYYIMVEGYDDIDTGTFNLTVSCDTATTPPPNDTCATAEALTLNANAVSGDNTNATSSINNPSCDDFGTISDVWYSFVAPASGNVTVVTTTSSANQANVVVWDDCAFTSEFGCSFNNAGETLDVTGLTGGTMYYIQVWNDGSAPAAQRTEGTFTIAVSETLSANSFDINGFEYFPNPVNDKLSLRAQNNIQNVSVFNILGQEVVRTTPNAVSSDVDMSQLSNGAYFVKVTINNKIETVKIIKK